MQVNYMLDLEHKVYWSLFVLKIRKKMQHLIIPFKPYYEIQLFSPTESDRSHSMV